MNIEERQTWKFNRMRKKIKLRELANCLNCSISFINKHENGHLTLDDARIEKYKRYIQEF